jgi:quinol monooxygenase YgiN
MGELKTNWAKVKAEYVTTNISYRKLAKKYGLTYTTVANYARYDNWVEARRAYKIETTSKIIDKCMTKEVRNEADKLQRMRDSADKLSKIIESSLNDEEQFNRHIIQTKKKDGQIEEWDSEERIYKKLDTRAIKDMTSAMKDLTSMLRNVYDLPTLQEVEANQLAKDKLALDREKASLFDDDEEDTGVVMLAPIKADADQE